MCSGPPQLEGVWRCWLADGYPVAVFASLRMSDFRYLFFGTFFGHVGFWMWIVGQGWLAFELTHSATFLGVLHAATAIPSLLIMLPSGVLADRWDRRAMIFYSNVVLAVASGVLMVLVGLEVAQPWQLVVLAALTGGAAAVNMPARQAMGPQLAGPGLTSNAVALSSLSFNASRVLGPACAGLLIAVVGLFGCFLAQTILLGVSAVLTGMIRTRGVPSPSGRPRSVTQNLTDGLEHSLRDPVLRGCIIVSLLHNLFGLTYSHLMPVFAGAVLGVGGAGLGTLLTAVGVGSAAGSVAAVMLSEHRQKGLIVFVTSVAFGIGIVLFAVASWLPLTLAALAFLGLVHAMASIANHTILNVASPDAYRGRVNSVFIFTWNIAPLSALPAGWLADQIGAPLTVGGSGVLTIVTLAVAALWLTALRTFRDADYVATPSGVQAGPSPSTAG